MRKSLPPKKNHGKDGDYRAVQGGVLFIFEDISGYGDFRLVHSTASGEIFDAKWNQKVKDQNLEIY